MPEITADAFVERISPQEIASLAELYDRFANALDPFSEERDNAERVFMSELAGYYDRIQHLSINYRDFKRAIILRCKRHLQKN